MKWICVLLCLLALSPAEGAPVLAKVKVHNPTGKARLGATVRGMLPLPKTFEGSIEQLALADGDRTLPTQVTVFATYPGSDAKHPVGRPEVVQLVSRLDLPEATFKELNVVRQERPGPSERPEQKEATPGKSIAAWLSGKAPLIVESRDVFGNVYRAEPLSPVHRVETRQSGPLLTEAVFQAPLLPVGPSQKSPPALKRFLLVRAYLTILQGEDFASLSILVFNGSLDAPNGNIYYRDLRLGLPKSMGLEVSHKRFSPAADTHQSTDGPTTWQPFPAPLSGGRVFVMPHGSAAVLRTTVTSPKAKDRALHHGSHPPIFVPVPSQDLYSWSNYSTARYDAVKHPLPLRLEADALERADKAVQERLGSPTLGWDLVYLREAPEGATRTLGHALPAGVAYGGMTGGAGVHYVFGAPAAVTGHNGLIHLHVLLADRNFDRQRIHLFHDDGTPYTHGDHLVEVDGKKYLDLPYNHRGFPELKIQDKACAIHEEHVRSKGLL